MKKIVFVLVVMLLILTVGCYGDKKPRDGYFRNNVYINEYLKMTIEFPENWVVAGDDNVEKSFSKTEDITLNPSNNNLLAFFTTTKHYNPEIGGADCSFEFLVQDYFRIPVSNLDEYIDGLRTAFEKDLDASTMKLPDEEINGIPYKKFELVKKLNGYKAKMVFYITLKKGKVIRIIHMFYDLDKESKEELKNIMLSIKMK